MMAWMRPRGVRDLMQARAHLSLTRRAKRAESRLEQAILVAEVMRHQPGDTPARPAICASVVPT